MRKCLFSGSVIIALFLAASVPHAHAESAIDVPVEPEWTSRTVTKADMRAARKARKPVLEHLFGDMANTVARFNRLDQKFVRAGTALKVPALSEGASEYVPLPAAYPPAEKSEKYILIVLDRQFLGTYSLGALVASYPISSGRPDYWTPVGTFSVSQKDEDHVSSKYPEPDGGWPMPWALRFRGSLYWIHGGDLPGHPASHGCVRLFPEDAEALFFWVEIGTTVRVVRSLE